MRLRIIQEAKRVLAGSETVRAAEIFPGLLLAVWNAVLIIDLLRLERRCVVPQRIADRQDLRAVRAFIRRDMLVSLLLLGTVAASEALLLFGFALDAPALESSALGI